PGTGRFDEHEETAARRRGWVDMRDATPGPDPLWLRRPGAAFWMEHLPDSRMLYIAYQAVQFASEGETNEAFFRRAFAYADSHDVARVVIDVRRNGGGNSFFNRPLVKEIIRRPALDRPDRLFTIIGRGTFSAAKNLLADLEYWTSATVVGEPNGNAPVQYGDAVSVVLPNSGITARVSTARHQTPRPRDERLFFAPRIFVEMTSEDYRLKRDPVLDAILRRTGGPSFARQLTEAVAAGDTALATRRLSDYRADPENRYAEADIERDVNAAAYALLGEGRVDGAIHLFRLNTAAFPQSANVHDSLGEAYERAGRREDAIREYRRALAIDPSYRSSLAGLQRLGA
ncbi:MAG: tetratricopeptide repeat protein, partial [Acidimicrobiales bacterium]